MKFIINRAFLGAMGLIYAHCGTSPCFSSSTETSLDDLPRPILHQIVSMAEADKSVRLVSKKLADRYELGGILNFPKDFGSKLEDLSCDIPHPKNIRVLDLTKISDLTPLGLKTVTEGGLCESLRKLLAKPDHAIGCLVISSGTDPKTCTSS